MPSKKTILSSLFWKFFERVGTQLMQFVVSVVLARILSPDDFGVIALVTIFIAIATVFVQSGLNTALIQKKDVSSVDFSSVFYASLAIAGAVYCLIFFLAPLIASFYAKPQLSLVLRVLSLTLFIGTFNSIQLAYISRQMLFKKLFYRSIGAMLPSGIFGIVLALMGFGVWALVGQQLLNGILGVLIMWFTVPWRPHFEFSFSRLKSLFSFGWKLLCSSLLDVGYNNLRGLVIGKVFSPADLAYYNRGDHLPNLLINNVNSSIQSVMLPSLSALQDNTPQLKRLMRRAIVTSCFLIMPLMAGLAMLAKPVVLILLGEKWLPAVPFVQAFCFVYAFWPIHTSNLSAINAMGRSDIFLKLEIIKKIMGIGILLGSLYYFNSPIGLAYGSCLSTIISSFINAYPNKKLINYGYIEQIKDIIPSICLSAVMGASLYALSLVQIPLCVSFPFRIVVAVMVYMGLAKLFHFECLDYLIQTFKNVKNRRNK